MADGEIGDATAVGSPSVIAEALKDGTAAMTRVVEVAMVGTGAMTAEEAGTTEMEGTAEPAAPETPVREMAVRVMLVPEMPVPEMGRSATPLGERSLGTEGTGGVPTAGMDGVRARRTAGRRPEAMIRAATEKDPAKNGTERVTATGVIAAARHMIGDSRRKQPHLKMDRVSAEMGPPAADRQGHHASKLGVFPFVEPRLRAP